MRVNPKNGIYPCVLERLVGVMCISIIMVQVWLKIHSNTLIFIFNPCHVVTVSPFTF